MSDIVRVGDNTNLTVPGGVGGPGGFQHAGESGPKPAEDAQLQDLLGSLRRHWLLISVISLVAGAAMTWWVTRQIPMYAATAVIRIADARSAMTGGLADNVDEAVLGEKADPLISHLQILKSRELIGRVVDREQLRFQASKGFNVALLQGSTAASPESEGTIALSFARDGFTATQAGARVRARYGAPAKLPAAEIRIAQRPVVTEAEVRVLDREKAIDELLEDLSTVQRENTNVVDVRFKHPSPAIARKTANTAVEEFRNTNAQSAQSQSTTRRRFLEEQLRTMDSLVAGSQQQLVDFRSRNAVYSSANQLTASQSSLAGLDAQRQELATERQVFADLLTRLSRTRGDDMSVLVSTPGWEKNPLLIQLATQLGQYETTRDSLTSGTWAVARTHPNVVRLDSLITRTRGRIQALARSHVLALNARIAAIDSARGIASRSMAAMPSTEAEEVRLTQELESRTRIVDQLRQEHQKARIAEAVEAGQIEIIDRATEPRRPLPNNGPYKVVFAMMVGFMGASVLGLVRDRSNKTIRHREDAEAVLNVPVLAIVPALRNTSEKKILPFRRSKSAALAVRPVVVDDYRAGGTEAYRTLRTNLLFSSMVGPLKRVAITSTFAAEGKTTTAANLAASFAQQGLRVLLVDCDLRRAQLHRTFDLQREPGLTNVLVGSATLDGAIRLTRIDGVSVLPAGYAAPNPTELLGSINFKETLDRAAADFDVMVIDAPPVMVAADAAIIGTLVDGMVMVVRAGATDRNAASVAVHQLASVGARILGSVLNDPHSSLQQYGYYYHEYYRTYHEQNT